MYLSEVLKDKLRIIDTDSASYSHIDEKCCFCNTKITKADVTFPNKVFESNSDYVAHGNCLHYVLEKYPNVPINDLHGKISRIKMEGSNVKF